MTNFIHHNTDGPDNPYSKVYDLAMIRHDFSEFRLRGAYKRWMHGPPLPVSWLPLGPLLGWHLWVHLTPIKTAGRRKSGAECDHEANETLLCSECPKECQQGPSREMERLERSHQAPMHLIFLASPTGFEPVLPP
jgi:hypothetical protein